MIHSGTVVRPRPTHTPNNNNNNNNKFDLTEIDTAEEAMLMPAADLWTGLVLGPLPGHVSISVGDQELSYESFPENGKLIYEGDMNGEFFSLEGESAKPRGIHVQGATPGGLVDSLRRGGGGGFGLDGSVGDIEFSQSLALDRSGGTSGNLAYLSGTIDGRSFQAHAKKGANDTVEVNGTLGETPIHQTISLGDEDEWIIRGELGPHQYTQVIERYSTTSSR